MKRAISVILLFGFVSVLASGPEVLSPGSRTFNLTGDDLSSLFLYFNIHKDSSIASYYRGYTSNDADYNKYLDTRIISTIANGNSGDHKFRTALDNTPKNGDILAVQFYPENNSLVDAKDFKYFLDWSDPRKIKAKASASNGSEEPYTLVDSKIDTTTQKLEYIKTIVSIYGKPYTSLGENVIRTGEYIEKLTPATPNTNLTIDLGTLPRYTGQDKDYTDYPDLYPANKDVRNYVVQFKVVSKDTNAATITFDDDVNPAANSSDTIKITATDADGIASTEYGFLADNICDNKDSYPNSFTSGTSFSIDNEDNNGLYICAKVTDNNGFITYKSSANPLKIDVTPPAIPTITLSDEATDGVIKNDEKASTNPTITIN